ncbi:MAG TPA: hypothetical protein VFU02_05185 [Polyangiaceae bacterium]|nr:hypothetical protein [Polyangiaceae bacterium]
MQKPLTERASTSPLTGATPGVAGRIADSPVVELLGYAYNQRFEGLLELSRDGGEKLGIGFVTGRVDGVVAPSMAEASQRHALEGHLPPETLEFAREHALAQGSDLLAAVETLQLLPAETRQLVRAECVTSQVIELCRLRGGTSYAFLSGGRQPSERALALSLDPLALLVSCILAEPALDRARRSVEAFREAPLTLVPGVEIDPAELRGVSRACIKRLQARPHSFSELDTQQAGASDEVTALVYALLLTGAVALRTGPSEYPRPVHNSHVPRSVSSHGMRAAGGDRPHSSADGSRAGSYSAAGDSERVAPAKRAVAPSERAAAPSERAAGPSERAAARSQRGVDRQRGLDKQRGASKKPGGPGRVAGMLFESPVSHPPASGSGDRVDSGHPAPPQPAKVLQEREAEAKVVNAWMMGEADRSFLEKARVFSGRVVKLFPKNPRIRYCFACLEKRAGNYDSAIREFARVLEIEPGNVDARNDLDQLMKWRKAQRRGEST